GQIVGSGKLRVGELLETDQSSRARVEVGLIGHVDIEPNSRIRLIDAKLTDHRLALEQGTIHATIWAPPRLFFVQTPSALAVDLGCVYTLHVDSTGASILEVTSGWVALEFGDRESIVPAGNICATRPGFGPGTPHREDGSEQFKQALTRYDFEHGGLDALTTVLAHARNMDSITLWHLLFREAGDTRALVYDRLAELVPAPEGVTRNGVLQGDADMVKAWQKHLNLGVKPWWKFWQ
ncbi:MAG: FecR domain-containing protein, partial [Bacteroidota bacterium]